MTILRDHGKVLASHLQFRFSERLPKVFKISHNLFSPGPRAMRRKRVDEILRPYRDGVPLDPAVSPGEMIIHAIELMVSHNVRHITVMKNHRPVGIVCLDDALRKVGLRGSAP